MKPTELIKQGYKKICSSAGPVGLITLINEFHYSKHYELKTEQDGTITLSNPKVDCTHKKVIKEGKKWVYYCK